MLKAIPNLQLFLTLVFLSLLILALDNFKILSLPKSGLYFLTNPISLGLYQTKQNTSSQFNFLFNARFAAKENQALQTQLQDLLSENAQIRRELAETQAKLAQQEAIPPATYKLQSARPIGLKRNLLLDKGSNDGVKVGQAVIFKDVLLGFIVETSEKGSQVRLLQDPDSKIAAFSQGKEGKAKGILLGQFGQGLLLDKILHTESIDSGDLIFSEGVENNVPRGLILGKVSSVDERENELFKRAKAEPIYKISDLDLVFIILD